MTDCAAAFEIVTYGRSGPFLQVCKIHELRITAVGAKRSEWRLSAQSRHALSSHCAKTGLLLQLQNDYPIVLEPDIQVAIFPAI